MRSVSIHFGLAMACAFSAAGQDVDSFRLDPTKSIHQYVLDVWSVEDGVPPHPIQDLLRSRDGYLWLATRGGLARFDGIGFTLFDLRNNPVLILEDMSSLAEDPEGNLWIGTIGGGLLRYRGGRFSVYRTGTPEGDVVESLAVDGEGTLWVGTRGGLFRFEDGTLRLAPTPEELASVRIRTLHVDAEGTLWLGTQGRGIYRYRDGRFTAFPVTELLRRATIQTLLRDRDETLWVGTEDVGLHRWTGSRWVSYDLVPGEGSESVFDLHEDLAGQVWIATNSDLYRYQPGGIETLTGRSNFRIRSLLEDDEGSLWIGTYQGLQRLKNGFITPFGAPEGLLEEHTRAVYEDRRGRLWLGTLGGGLHVVAGNEVRAFTTTQGFPSDWVWSILEARDGTFWLGTDDGLVRALSSGDGFESFELYTVADGPMAHPVRVVFEDPDEPGTLWLGTIGGGLFRWRGGVQAHFGTAEGLADGDIRWILKASSSPGDLWLGTQLGLHRLREGRFTVYTTANGLSSNFIPGAHMDAAGHLWLGTFGGGLVRFADGRFTAYNTRDGLPFNDVWCILESDGDFWLSNDQGIFRVARKSLDAYDEGRIATIPVSSYGRSDGMRTIEVNGGGFPCASSGSDSKLWFPTLAGVIRLDLADLRARNRPPPVVIEKFLVDGAPIDLGSPIRLPPVRGDLEILFTGLSLWNPERLRFRYRLDGYDEDWVDAGARRQAFYTQIPHGSYRFQVLALAEETRSAEPAELLFTIVPHVYETWWFAALCALGTATAIYGGFRFRTRRIRAHNVRLQVEVAQRQQAEAALARAVTHLEDRNEELRAKNAEMERFTYTVSHDLKSPLVTIKGFLGLLRQDSERSEPERVEKDITTISGAVDVMQELLDDLLEWSRVGRMVHPAGDLALAELAREAVARVRGAIDEKRVEVVIGPDLPVIFGDRQRLVQVLQNLIENAVKYMGGQSAPRVEIGACECGSELIVFVRDNGVGVEPRYHRKIFGLFERLDASGEGTGVGLALVERIIELHGGRVWVESQGQGTGSRFCLTLPRRDDP